MRGTIQTLFSSFGFIRVSGMKDHFFYATAVSPLSVGFGELEQGDVVEFESVDHPKGKRAIGVVLMGKAGDIQQAEEEDEDGNKAAAR